MKGKNNLETEKHQKTPKTTPKKERSVYEGCFSLLARSPIFSKASLRVSSPSHRRCTVNYGTVMETVESLGENVACLGITQSTATLTIRAHCKQLPKCRSNILQ